MVFNDLKNNFDLCNIPNKKGVYYIKKCNDFNFKVCDNEYNHKISCLYAVKDLRNKYEIVKDSEILYIGKAGGKKGLNQRLKQFIKFGLGEGLNHRGGRAIFQLVNWECLIVEYIECDNCEQLEKQELIEFKNKYGSYPFANHRK